MCDPKIGRLRLHDPKGARFRIPDAKTESGVREVQMSPDLVEAVVEHLERLRRMGAPTGADDYLVLNTRERLNRQRVGQIVSAAAELASERLGERGLSNGADSGPNGRRGRKSAPQSRFNDSET